MKSSEAKKSISKANEEIAATESVIDQDVKAVEKKATKRTKKADVKDVDSQETTEKAGKKNSTKKSTSQASKKVIDTRIVFQFLGNDIEPKNLLEQAKADYLAAGGKEKDIKAMELYIKPEDNAAYYVVNGVPAGKVTIFA